MIRNEISTRGMKNEEGRNEKWNEKD